MSIIHMTSIMLSHAGLDGGIKTPSRKSIKLKESTFLTEGDLRTCNRGPFRTYGRSFSFEISHYCASMLKRSVHDNYFLARDCDKLTELELNDCSNSFMCTDRNDFVNMKIDSISDFEASDAIMPHEPKLNFVDNVKLYVALS